MPAQLLALTEGPDILLDKPILLLGRHPECDIQIDSKKISRRHCCIAQVNDYLVIRDLGSTNGIRINGTRVLEGRLFPDDELTIGHSRYKVSWNNQLASDEPASMRGAREPSSPVVPPLGADDDQLLESCEEPVPLKESGGAKVPVAPPVATRPPGAVPMIPLVPVFDDEDSVPAALPDDLRILPEDLHLAPFSDAKPPSHPASSPSSASNH